MNRYANSSEQALGEPSNSPRPSRLRRMLAGLTYDEQVRLLAPPPSERRRGSTPAAEPTQRASVQMQQVEPNCELQSWSDYVANRLERTEQVDAEIFWIDFAVSSTGVHFLGEGHAHGEMSPSSSISPPELTFLQAACRQYVGSEASAFAVYSLRFVRQEPGWQLDSQEVIARGRFATAEDLTLPDLAESAFITDEAVIADAIVNEIRETRFMIVELAGELLAEHDPRRIENIAWSAVGYFGVPAVVRGVARFRGPAARSFDWGHIFDRHWEFGDIARRRIEAGNTRGIFHGLSQAQIRARVRAAWRNRTRMETQLTGEEVRIRFRGVDPESGQTVEFWYLQNTRTVQTAYPID